MTVLPTDAPAPRDDRAASAVLHDSADARVVAFTLKPGQHVPPHRSKSTVVVQVASGEGTFRGGDGVGHVLRAGGAAVFAPQEEHSIEAGAEPLRFIAVISPAPGA